MAGRASAPAGSCRSRCVVGRVVELGDVDAVETPEGVGVGVGVGGSAVEMERDGPIGAEIAGGDHGVGAAVAGGVEGGRGGLGDGEAVGIVVGIGLEVIVEGFVVVIVVAREKDIGEG